MSDERTGRRRGARIAALAAALAGVVLGLGWCASQVVLTPPSATPDEAAIAGATDGEVPVAGTLGGEDGRRRRPRVRQGKSDGTPFSGRADTTTGTVPTPGSEKEDKGVAREPDAESDGTHVDARNGYSAQVIQPPGMSGAGFGSSVAIDGSVAVISAPQTTLDPKQGKGRGRVFVYEARDGTWYPTAVLEAPKTGKGIFGRGVAVSNGRIAVTDAGTSSTRAVVHFFEKKEGQWGSTQRMVLETGRYDSISIDLDDDLLVVGTGYDVDVYRRLVHDYRFQERLPRDEMDTLQGSSFAVDGERIAVFSKEGGANGRGAIHVFTSSVGAFQLRATIQSDDARQGQDFVGTSLAMSSATLVVAGQRIDRGVVALERGKDGWAATSQIAVRKALSARHSGRNVLALDGDLMAAGMVVRTKEKSGGGLFVARRRGSAWTQGVVDPRAAKDDDLRAWIDGPSVAVSGNTVLVGAVERMDQGRAAFLTLDADFPGVRAKE